MRKAAFFYAVIVLAFILVAGFLVPGRLVVPVKGATRADWNPKAFGFYPWGKSGVHKGIDVFAREGTPVISASSGVVVGAEITPDGGNVISILGPQWRIHYYAHLKTSMVTAGTLVSQGTQIGTVGATGNAAGKPPHLHYAIITQFPYIWLYRNDRFGSDRMFYLNPDEQLRS
jgi:murein DD-endopeptidase MepM/ murein hydrolase activator NlpD